MLSDMTGRVIHMLHPKTEFDQSEKYAFEIIIIWPNTKKCFYLAF